LHDGLRAGLFTENEVAALPIIGAAYAEVDAAYPGLDPYRRRHEALRRVFGVMVGDVIEASRAILAEVAPADSQAVRDLGRPVIRFSDALWADLRQIRAFLFTRMYRSPPVMVMRAEVTQVVDDLFPFYLDQPAHLPQRWQSDVAAAGTKPALARLVCDYIAGMTDRFALTQHARHLGGKGGAGSWKG
jgi:dGTPase